MIVGLFTGASSMVSQGDYQAVIARNLANINTAGYKKNVAVFQSYMSGSTEGKTNTASGTGSSLGKVATDFSQGMLEYTGNDLDISIQGDGFFAVKAANGDTLYTRKGQFMLSRDMKVVTPEGWSLLGNGGEIQIPQKTKSVSIKDNGSIVADGKEIGKMRIFKVSKLSTLESVGGCAYKIAENAQQPEDLADFKIASRYLEKSNVNAVDEMVNMIANMRGFQVGHKVTDSIDESLKKLIQLAS
ncbi:MAG: flagellar basal-body rod protein FlgF [Planctomycetes bacterium]|nr:flagellar basal-body rod protein FlgF [Planctomycetota bacterium]